MAKIKDSSTELIWIFHQKAGSIRRDQPSRRSLIFLVGTTSDMLGALSRNGRCSAFASSHGARIHTSHSFCICENHGHCPGMDRFNDRVGFRGQEAVDQVRTGDWLGLDAAVALVLGPEPAEGEQRSVLIERKPNHVLFLVSGLVVRPICAKPGTFGGFFYCESLGLDQYRRR